MSRNERKTNKGTANAGPENSRKAASQQRNSKTPNESDLLRQKIETVKSVTNWPDEDIVRVLEKCNGNTDLAMNNILDGLEKEPNSWKEVMSKARTKAENKVKLPKNTQDHPKPNSSPRPPKPQRKPEAKEGETRSDPRKRVPNTRAPQRETTQDPTPNEARQPKQEGNKELAPVNEGNLDAPSSQSYHGEVASEDLTGRYSSTPASQVHPQETRGQELSNLREEIHELNAPAGSGEGSASAQGNNPSNLSYPASRQYHPPGMKAWKPKEQKASQAEAETAPATSSHASRSVSSTPAFSVGPVVLPSVLKAQVPADTDFQFGNFNGPAVYEQPEAPASKMSSQLPINNLEKMTLSSPEVALSSTEQELPSREQEMHQVQNQPSGYGYIRGFVPPHYNGHFQNYEANDVPHFATFDAEVGNLRQPVYDGQNFQAPSTYQREPSPTDAAKYLPRDNIPSTYRENKFQGQEVGQSGPQTGGAATAQTHATQGAYPSHYSTGGPIYAYASYIPGQYGSYQNPQHSQYPYPRYYRAPFPSYSGTGGAYPPTSGSSSVFPEEMVQGAEYKTMFPTMPSSPFFHAEGNMSSIIGKNPPSQATQQGGSSSKNQSFSPPPSAPPQSGASPDLSANSAYKAQQVAYQNPSIPRDSSYYNMIQQQYGQQTTPAFPYIHMPQQFPNPRGQQYIQN